MELPDSHWVLGFGQLLGLLHPCKAGQHIEQLRLRESTEPKQNNPLQHVCCLQPAWDFCIAGACWWESCVLSSAEETMEEMGYLHENF